MRVACSLRSVLVLACALAAGLTSPSVEAAPASTPGSIDDPTLAPSPAPPAETHESPVKTSPDDANDAFRLGALAGVGFPRPVSFEAFSRLGGYVGVGAEYGLLPTVSLDGVSVSSWAATADVRVFPFHGAFFLGLRGGYQRIDASASVSVAGVGSASSSANLDTWFVNPRVGFLWTMKYGFTIAMEGGVEIPVTSSFSTSLPSAVALQVRESTPVATLSGVLPTVDLLRIGLLF